MTSWRVFAFLKIQLSNNYAESILRRHCERSEAIHVAARKKSKMDCFRLRSLSYGGQVAALAMTVDMVSRSRGTSRPRFASWFGPLRNRGRREDRVLAAPAVSRAICANKTAHEHTGQRETLRPSLRNGFTAYFVLSPENGSFASVAREKLFASPGLSASTAAPEPHDFAVRIRRVLLSRPQRPSHLTARS